MSNPIHVAVAVIRNQSGQVFITRRADHVHQGGLWEFPGGKVEGSESVESALRREIHEENGIEIVNAKPLIRIPYQYPDKTVLLDVWDVLEYSGDPHGREGQPCDWVSVDNLDSIPFPAANHSIVSAVQLPSLFLVTPEPENDWSSFLNSLEQSIIAGQRWIQLRAKSLSGKQYLDLAKSVSEICSSHKAKLMLNADIDTVYSLATTGLHVSTSQLMNLSDRPIGEDKWFSASCHTEDDIKHANSIGVDFIFVGSVKQTSSHRERQPIGWEVFSRLTDIATMPVYAIGGMTLDDVEKCRAVGGQGIAAISALWKSK